VLTRGKERYDMQYGVLMRSTASVLMMSMTVSACYQYVPVDQEAPRPDPGEEVRARLSPSRSFDLGTVIVNEVNSMEGTLYQNNGDDLAMWTQWLWTTLDVRVAANGSVFYVPHQQITSLEVRRLQPAKSIMLIGALAGSLVALFAIAASGGSGSGGPPVEPRPSMTAPLSIPLIIGR
jgi:hypothetical protein